MLREHQYVFNRVSMALDLSVTAGAVLLAHVVRNGIIAPYLLPDVFCAPSRFSDYSWLVWVLPFIMVGFLAHNGYYLSQRAKTFLETARAAVVSAFETAIAAIVISFLFVHENRTPQMLSEMVSGDQLSRGVILLVPIILSVLMLVKTYAMRRALVALRRRGTNWRSFLLVGSGQTLRHFLEQMRNNPFWGLRIEGIIDDSGREAKAVDGIPVVGTLPSLFSYLEKHPVDEVVFVPARRSLEELTPYFEGCEEMGLRTQLCLNFFRYTIARPVLHTFEEIPLVTYSPVKELSWALLVKYAFDRLTALILLLIFSPVFAVIAAVIKLTSQSWDDPIFYGQVRCGLNGKHFKLWKFRSMKVNADAELEKLRAMNEMQGPVFKMKHDPRITAIGRFLRKTSMDELPQLWNVLRGDMSLVGPRPPIPSEVEKYDRWQRRRLSMKPGITCLWQVMGRNHLSFDTWMKLDLQYIDNWSLGLDFKILLRTVYVVATGYGAM